MYDRLFSIAWDTAQSGCEGWLASKTGRARTPWHISATFHLFDAYSSLESLTRHRWLQTRSIATWDVRRLACVRDTAPCYGGRHTFLFRSYRRRVLTLRQEQQHGRFQHSEALALIGTLVPLRKCHCGARAMATPFFLSHSFSSTRSNLLVVHALLVVSSSVPATARKDPSNASRIPPSASQARCFARLDRTPVNKTTTTRLKHPRTLACTSNCLHDATVSFQDPLHLRTRAVALRNGPFARRRVLQRLDGQTCRSRILVRTPQQFSSNLTSISPLHNPHIAYSPSYSNTLTPSQIPYRKFTHIHYFVFTTTPSATTLSRAGIPESVIKDFVARAKAAGVSTSYSVGGWTGSKYFSQHVKSAYTRSLFAKTMVATMKQYGFDGIGEFDFRDESLRAHEADPALLPSQTWVGLQRT